MTLSDCRPVHTSTSPLTILQTVFGHQDFRGRQREVVDHLVAGGDALVLMPTGGGKSICYQVPALCRPGTAVVVSPLIALMRDQVASLRQSGVNGAFLNSSQREDAAQVVRRDLMAGKLDLLYVAPERLVMPGFLDMLKRVRVSLFAIDEAHCVSQWGHDFRPEYIRLSVLAELFPDVPRIALTATADPRTREDIRSRLQLDHAPVFISSFDRPNLAYSIRPKSEPKAQLLAFLKHHAGESGIVYCLSRNKVEDTAAWLESEGYPALPYHAGLPPEVREQNQDRFVNGDGLIMVATVAFGMGIDADVRFVAHLDLPATVEAYYQETGRAGRDGLPAEAWMVYSMADAAQRRRMIDESGASDDVKKVEHSKLDALLGLCETPQCRRRTILAYFGETLERPCGNCDNCLDPPETWDGTEAARKALSAIYRTGQRFGSGHVVDVLLGRKTDKVTRFDHDALPTFGVGQGISRTEWQSVLRQLLAFGKIAVDYGMNGALRLTESARPLLRGEEKAIFKRDDPKAGRGDSGRRETPNPLDDLPSAGRALFQGLREARKQLAVEAGLPPYVVCHDATLVSIVRVRPRTLADFTRVHGMGATRIEKYGQCFLDVVRRFE